MASEQFAPDILEDVARLHGEQQEEDQLQIASAKARNVEREQGGDV